MFLVCSMALAVMPLAAEDDVRVERIHFEKGSSSSEAHGEIKGYGTVEYQIGAAAGQTMRVSLETAHTATYFNVFAPGTKPGADAAIFRGEVTEGGFDAKLEKSGDYMVQVYMMRSAARRDETAKFTVKVAIDNAPMH